VSDVLDRIGAVNPVPQQPPASAWTASVLLDEIDARRGRMTKIDETETTPVGSPKQLWGLRIAAAAGAFVVVLAVVGVIGLIANGGGSDVVDTPTTESPPTTDAVSTAESFFTAFLRGDWDAANELGQGVLISGENGNVLWGIDVVGTDCELVAEFLVRCTSTRTDAVTRQISAAYAWEAVGTMTVVDGVVTGYTSENQPDPVFERYEAWLDAESPDGWVFLECTHGGYRHPPCIPIYLANVEAWLETSPDLSEIANAQQMVSTAEAFYLAYLEGDSDSALDVSDNQLPSELGIVNVLWGIEVVGIDCELPPAGAIVTCVATVIDNLARQIGPAYTHRFKGKIDVVDGVVTYYEIDLGVGRYEAWLDAKQPDGWVFLECTHGGYRHPPCIPIYLANVEAWLATDPDLSDIDEG
jgi:hypothetical protein